MFKRKREFNRNKQIILKNKIFNSTYYLRHNRDARVASETPIDHFLKYGLYEGRKPNERFDPAWYLKYYTDVAKEGFNSLLHFVLFGIHENRFMNQQEMDEYNALKKTGTFDTDTYKNKYADLQTQGEGFDFLLHYIRLGAKEGRSPLKLKVVTAKKLLPNHSEQLKIIKTSDLFDNNYYLGNYFDVAKSGMDAINHYCTHGWKEGRNPSNYFNTNYYLSTYTDVRENDINPLYHFIKSGAKENRNPNEFFDTKFYLEEYTDVKISKMNPLQHYIKHGEEEGRKTQAQQHISAEFCNYVKLRNIQSQLQVAVVVQVNAIENWDKLLQRLKTISCKYSLYIITTKELYNQLAKLEMPKVRIKVLQNYQARADVYHAIRLFDYLRAQSIDVFCRLQINPTTNTQSIIDEALIELNIGSDKIFSGVINAFEKDNNLKFIGPVCAYKNIQKYNNFTAEQIKKLETAFDFEQGVLTDKGFFAGSMFWGRVPNKISLIKTQRAKNFKLFKEIINTDESFYLALEIIFAHQHNKDKKIGLIFKGNKENDHFVEKIADTGFIKNNFDATITQLNTLEYDYKLLSNARFFNRETYNLLFPHISGHGISPEHHFLSIGRHLVKSEIATKVLDAFNYNPSNAKGIPPCLYLGLKGAMYEKEFKHGSDLDYEFSRMKVKIHEAHLINWDNEHCKSRNTDIVSIVIPVYGQAELTDNCLESIINTPAGTEYEIIVVNNGQNLADVEALAKWGEYACIKIINNFANLNFALGCNLGFSRSIGNKVVFLNNDTTVTNNWLVNLVAPLDNQNISITQPKLLYPGGKLQCMGVVFSDKSKLAYPLYQNQDVPPNVLTRNRNFNAVTGACLAVKAEDFALIKGFDTNYINGQEDIDFCLTLNRFKNTKAMYVANSTVYHYEGKSTGRGRFVANNRKHFIEKWGNSIVADDEVHYKMDGAIVEKWTLDSPTFKAMKIENYIPVIEFKLQPVDDIALIAPLEFFHITGNLYTNPSKKTIMICAHSVSRFIFGGERSFLDMVKAIDKNKYNVIITIPNRQNIPYLKMLAEHAIGIYSVRYKMWSTQGPNNRVVKLLENLIKSESVDLIYVNTIMCREPLIAAKTLNKRRIIHIRELIDKDEHLLEVISQDSDNIVSEVISSSDYLFANSKITKKLFNTQNIETIYNQIETPLYQDMEINIDPNKIKFTMLSSNIPKKGIYDFIEIAKICKNIKNAHFVLVGPLNTFVYQLKEIIKQENLRNVTIAGYYDDPIDAIKEANVILSLSHFAESFGRTVGEACAGQRPVIAYKYGAIPEIIEHEKNGYLTGYKDIKEVAHYVEIFCKNPEKIKSMGKTGRKIITRMSSPKVYNLKLNNALNKCFELHKPKITIGLTIIVPIYNAYQEVINCIDSLLNTTSHLELKVMLIDDGSPDKRMKPMLQKYNQLANIRVIFNEDNIGYTKTVNKGIELAENDDVILLNSDTITTNNWVESLLKTANQSKDTGTVTAMSDNAGAFSFPKQSVANPKPKQIQYNNYAEIVLRESNRVPAVAMPTGSGFCFFIKRKLINDIGVFDHDAFPRGYGEENDFCMRAIANGWENLVASNTFIFHIRTASFGNEKEKLVSQGVATVIKRYPSYNQDVHKALGSTAMRRLRLAVQNAVATMYNL